jgi:urease accessory protein
MTIGAVVDAPDAVSTASVPAGTGRLHFAAVGGRTVVSRALASSPLKLLTPRNGGHAAWVYTATYGGGLVDGDRISLAIDADPRTAALLSTQASTKVYRSPRGTSSELSARVGDGALLVVMPDPVVCFAQATYRQVHEFDLEPGGSLVLVDWMTAGRRAAGERWKFDAYESRIAIRVDGCALLYDSMRLCPGDGVISDRLGRFNVVALLAVIGPKVDVHARSIHAAIGGQAVRSRPDQLEAATTLEDGGCLVRMAGVSVEQVAATIRQHLNFVPVVLGDDPWTRKW